MSLGHCQYGFGQAPDGLAAVITSLCFSPKNGQPLKPKPVNNCRTDKLDSFMWRHSFRERRCLIPVTGFCEAEGEKGAKTRTWFSLPGEELFAVAGIWRDTAEWGPAYSMVMTEACEHVAGVHDRDVGDPAARWTGWTGRRMRRGCCAGRMSWGCGWSGRRRLG